ncbi:MAG: cysteine desulfurase, partial [Verrucomicrobiales bacterium]
CASGKEAPSENLLALGYTAAQASRALRFSSGLETTNQDWIQLAETLESIYAEFIQTPQLA